MAPRKAKFFIAIALVVLVATATVLWAFARGDGGPHLKWTFIGYTNEFGSTDGWSQGIACALVYVANEGKVPLKLHHGLRPYADLPFDRPLVGKSVGLPLLSANGMVVEPGKGTVIRVALNPGQSWFAQLCTQQYCWRERICEKVKNTVGPRTAKLAGKLLAPSERVWVTIGPVTNLTSDTGPPYPPRVARP